MRPTLHAGNLMVGSSPYASRPPSQQPASIAGRNPPHTGTLQKQPPKKPADRETISMTTWGMLTDPELSTDPLATQGDDILEMVTHPMPVVSHSKSTASLLAQAKETLAQSNDTSSLASAALGNPSVTDSLGLSSLSPWTLSPAPPTTLRPPEVFTESDPDSQRFLGASVAVTFPSINRSTSAVAPAVLGYIDKIGRDDANFLTTGCDSYWLDGEESSISAIGKIPIITSTSTSIATLSSTSPRSVPNTSSSEPQSTTQAPPPTTSTTPSSSMEPTTNSNLGFDPSISPYTDYQMYMPNHLKDDTQIRSLFDKFFNSLTRPVPKVPASVLNSEKPEFKSKQVIPTPVIGDGDDDIWVAGSADRGKATQPKSSNDPNNSLSADRRSSVSSTPSTNPTSATVQDSTEDTFLTSVPMGDIGDNVGNNTDPDARSAEENDTQPRLGIGTGNDATGSDDKTGLITKSVSQRSQDRKLSSGTTSVLADYAEVALPSHQLTLTDRSLTLTLRTPHQRSHLPTLLSLSTSDPTTFQLLERSATACVNSLRSLSMAQGARATASIIVPIESHLRLHSTVCSDPLPLPVLPLPRAATLEHALKNVVLDAPRHAFLPFRAYFNSESSRAIITDAFWYMFCDCLLPSPFAVLHGGDDMCARRGRLAEHSAIHHVKREAESKKSTQPSRSENEREREGTTSNFVLVDASQISPLPPLGATLLTSNTMGDSIKKRKNLRGINEGVPCVSGANGVGAGGKAQWPALTGALFDRMAISYVQLFTTIERDHKDMVLSSYFDCVCQAVTSLLTTAFPEMQERISSTRLSMLRSFASWTLGYLPNNPLGNDIIIPRPPDHVPAPSQSHSHPKLNSFGQNQLSGPQLLSSLSTPGLSGSPNLNGEVGFSTSISQSITPASITSSCSNNQLIESGDASSTGQGILTDSNNTTTTATLNMSRLTAAISIQGPSIRDLSSKLDEAIRQATRTHASSSSTNTMSVQCSIRQPYQPLFGNIGSYSQFLSARDTNTAEDDEKWEDDSPLAPSTSLPTGHPTNGVVLPGAGINAASGGSINNINSTLTYTTPTSSSTAVSGMGVSIGESQGTPHAYNVTDGNRTKPHSLKGQSSGNYHRVSLSRSMVYGNAFASLSEQTVVASVAALSASDTAELLTQKPKDRSARTTQSQLINSTPAHTSSSSPFGSAPSHSTSTVITLSTSPSPPPERRPGDPWAARRIVKQTTILQHSGFIHHFLQLRGIRSNGGSQISPSDPTHEHPIKSRVDPVCIGINANQTSTKLRLSYPLPQGYKTRVALQHLASELHSMSKQTASQASLLSQFRRQMMRESQRDIQTMAEDTRTQQLARKRAMAESTAFAAGLVEVYRNSSGGVGGVVRGKAPRPKRTSSSSKAAITTTVAGESNDVSAPHVGSSEEPTAFAPTELALMRRVHNRAREYEVTPFTQSS